MMNQWDGYAERARQQLPAAPEPLLDGYVKWAPWVAMVFGALGAIVAVAGLMGLSVVVASGVPAGFGALVNVALLLVVCVLEFIGGYQMRQGSLTGWWILAIGLALNLLSSLLSIAILGIIITLAVAYVHLHVKPRYH